jgi:DNA (cytosine-5)-methyltransferase 1
MEAAEYAIAAAVLGAHSVGAPHIRQRLYLCAHTEHTGHDRPGRIAAIPDSDQPQERLFDGDCSVERSAHAAETRRTDAGEHGSEQPERIMFGSHPLSPRLERHFGDVPDWRGPGWLDPLTARSVAKAGATRGFWADCDWWHARDGKYRPIEPGIFPLAHGVANRVLKLRGYGDAINAEVAAEFIKTAAESIDERQSTRHHLSCAR